MRKLTQEEMGALSEAFSGPARVALKTLIDGLVARVNERVRAYRMTAEGAAPEKLVALKCAAEGAETLAASLWAELDENKKTFVPPDAGAKRKK